MVGGRFSTLGGRFAIFGSHRMPQEGRLGLPATRDTPAWRRSTSSSRSLVPLHRAASFPRSHDQAAASSILLVPTLPRPRSGRLVVAFPRSVWRAAVRLAAVVAFPRSGLRHQQRMPTRAQFGEPLCGSLIRFAFPRSGLRSSRSLVRDYGRRVPPFGPAVVAFPRSGLRHPQGRTTPAATRRAGHTRRRPAGQDDPAATQQGRKADTPQRSALRGVAVSAVAAVLVQSHDHRAAKGRVVEPLRVLLATQ